MSAEWDGCIECLEEFRYDDCGGYNPPCSCGLHCRRCHEIEMEREADRDEDEDDYRFCESVSSSGGVCCRDIDHDGPHQDTICNGTCDTCDCDEWTDTPPDADAPQSAVPTPSLTLPPSEPRPAND